jgi:hypothetical protein
MILAYQTHPERYTIKYSISEIAIIGAVGVRWNCGHQWAFVHPLDDT